MSGITFGQDLLITGVIDASLTGGTPKALELYVINDISDLSIYGVESVTNGNPSSDTPEYTFPADAVASGTFIYLESVSSNNPTAFHDFMGFNSTYQNGVLSVNGDDPIKLYKNGIAIDVFGSVGTDGSGEPWEYMDGWAYRKNGKSATNTFSVSDWTFSGPNALDGQSTNAAATKPFPNGTYSSVASTVPAITITSPKSGSIYNVTSVDVSIVVDNFNFSGDSGSGVSDNSGDGYLKATLETQGGSTEVSNFFSTTLPAIEVVPGTTYTLTLELVDNTGASLSTVVSESVTFNIEYPCNIQLDSYVTTCDANTTGDDTYSVSIPFTGGNSSRYTLTADSGTIGGDDPSTTESGTITITGITEGTTVVFTVKGDVTDSSCDISRNIYSPTCVPAPTCPAVGSVIITEIFQNPSAVADNSGEYFEVYNTTGSPIDLLGWILKDTSSTSETHTIETSVVVPANGYAVLGVNTDVNTNGGVANVSYSYGSNYYLGNGSDDIVLECGGTIIDIVEWDGGTEFPDPTGKSMELATNKYTATDNDMGANWAEATAEIVKDGDLGTPGAVNSFVLSVNKDSILGFATYPNPITNKRFTISSSNADLKEVSIFNVLGKEVFSTSFSGLNKNIDVSAITSGVYILKVTEAGKTATKKLVVR